MNDKLKWHDKCLVRNNENDEWVVGIFISEDKSYKVNGTGPSYYLVYFAGDYEYWNYCKPLDKDTGMINILEDRYYDRYRDVHFEIRNWRYAGRDLNWNYYVNIKNGILPPEKWKALWVDNFVYLDSELENIPMHGGISFCKRDHDNQIIEIGCDYGHHMDEGNEYSVDKILVEVKETIDYILDTMSKDTEMKKGTCDKHSGVHIEFESLECPLCRLENVEKELEEKRQALRDADDYILDTMGKGGRRVKCEFRSPIGR